MLVPESSNDARLNRRALLLGAVFLVGGTAALTRFSRDPQDTAESGPVFTPDQFALLEQVTEVMIPATDTPGALGAGVPAFLRQLLSAWGSNETRVAVVRVLEAIQKESWGKSALASWKFPASGGSSSCAHTMRSRLRCMTWRTGAPPRSDARLSHHEFRCHCHWFVNQRRLGRQGAVRARPEDASDRAGPPRRSQGGLPGFRVALGSAEPRHGPRG